jgi:hypothetical protein
LVKKFGKNEIDKDSFYEKLKSETANAVKKDQCEKE